MEPQKTKTETVRYRNTNKTFKVDSVVLIHPLLLFLTYLNVNKVNFGFSGIVPFSSFIKILLPHLYCNHRFISGKIKFNYLYELFM